MHRHPATQPECEAGMACPRRNCPPNTFIERWPEGCECCCRSSWACALHTYKKGGQTRQHKQSKAMLMKWSGVQACQGRRWHPLLANIPKSSARQLANRVARPRPPAPPQCRQEGAGRRTLRQHRFILVAATQAAPNTALPAWQLLDQCPKAPPKERPTTARGRRNAAAQRVAHRRPSSLRPMHTGDSLPASARPAQPAGAADPARSMHNVLSSWAAPP